MPTISSEIISVDTLQIKPAAQAFEGGQLYTGAPAAEQIQAAADTWSLSALNWGLMAFCIILAIIAMRRYISVFPYVSGGFFRWKEILNMENNMRLSRERNSVAAAAVPICLVCVSRLNLINAGFMDALTPGMKTLSIIGILLAFLAVRWLFSLAIPSGRLRGNTARAADGAWGNFTIALSSALLLLLVIRSVSDGCAQTAESISLYVTAFLWVVFLVRKYQILAYDCGQFKSFLYLCGVEILPAAMLVVSSLYL